MTSCKFTGDTYHLQTVFCLQTKLDAVTSISYFWSAQIDAKELSLFPSCQSSLNLTLGVALLPRPKLVWLN